MSGTTPCGATDVPVRRIGPITGQEHFGHGFETYVTIGLLGKLARRSNVQLPPLSEVSSASPVVAWLQEDRWVAVCPDCGQNAQLIWADAMLYLCTVCWNAAVGSTWRRVVFPKDRGEIEVIVGARPLAHNRNWTPGERVSALRAENLERGLPAERRSR